jgi:hypothetical protein
MNEESRTWKRSGLAGSATAGALTEIGGAMLGVGRQEWKSELVGSNFQGGERMTGQVRRLPLLVDVFVTEAHP